MAGSSSAKRIKQELIASVHACLYRSGSTAVGLSVLFAVSLAGLMSPLGEVAESRSAGVLKLTAVMQLLQGYRATPSAVPPQLWNQRLGIEPARRLWRRLGGGLWWQGWTADGQSYLVLPAGLFDGPELGQLTVTRVDGLQVLSADALNQNQLLQRLALLAQKSPSPSPLERACLHRLTSMPTVYWRPEALAKLSGALTPLLQQARFGCLSLRMDGDQLRWHGWGSSRDFASAPAALDPSNAFVSAPTLIISSDAQKSSGAPAPLLWMQGDHLATLLGPLASRQIIRTPLEQHYGLGPTQRQRLMKSPFKLRLVGQDQPPFKAGVQVQLSVGEDYQRLSHTLDVVAGRLKDQGLRMKRTGPDAWVDPNISDASVVGGWLWLSSKSQNGQLSVGIGMPPATQAFTGKPSLAGPGTLLTLLADPVRLDQRQLLPGSWSKVVRTSRRLQLSLHRLGQSQATSADWLEIRGQLSIPIAGQS